MASQTSTFATLRALQLVIADALDDIQRVFSQSNLPSPPSSPPSQCPSPDPSQAVSPFPVTPPSSFPPTPLSSSFPSTLRSPPRADMIPFVDYPSPDSPLVVDSLGEQLALHPDAAAAASRIVAACGQMTNIVYKPFSSLCDAIMSYNLPACMRLAEHLHVAEILREAQENGSVTSGQQVAVPLYDAKVNPSTGESAQMTPTEARTPAAGVDDPHAHRVTEGLHVADITNIICSYAGINYVDSSDLVHALRLLSTHHIFRETAPDTFALTRVASLLDSGKSVKAVFSNPEAKYDDTGGIPAFVALITDELFKSAAYLTEAFTGVQPQTSASAPTLSRGADVTLPGATTVLSTSNNDLAPCNSTTRSSSILTHIVYPEGELRPSSQSPSPAEPPEKHPTHSLPKNGPLPCQPPATGSSVPPPDRSLTKTLAQMAKDRLRSGDAVRSEKVPAFNLAFHTYAPYFDWLDNGGKDPLGGTGQGACVHAQVTTGSTRYGDVQPGVPSSVSNCVPSKSFRFDRFSKAMMGTTLWEAPKAILSGFDWHSLPKGSTIVDVGGGIGSTTMILACALDSKAGPVKKRADAHNSAPGRVSDAVLSHKSKVLSDASFIVSGEPRDETAAGKDVNLRFVVQDKPIVIAAGIEAWRSKCPEMLESGQVVFQDHDFFEPQPPLESPHLTRYPTVYLLRVVLHDWPDESARRILINLRVASSPETRLVIAEHVLPLACADGGVLVNVDTEKCERSSTGEWTLSSALANVEGAERTLVPPPLLPNLGKASANAYWMDLLMHITFNGKERTLREFCALALSAGWRVMRITRPEGTLFAYLVCEPITLPDDAQAIHNALVLSSELASVVIVPSDEPMRQPCVESSRYKQLPARPVSLLSSPILDRSSSRCGTPTFGSRMLLPHDEELQSPRTRGAGAAKKWLKSKGLGMRGVMIQKAEKQREEQNLAKVSVRDNDDVPNGSRTSPHMRVWWKKSPPNSTGNSSAAIHGLSGDVSERRATGRGRRGSLKASDTPSTPSPRIPPDHQKWPSTESAALLSTDGSPPLPRARRPSVASITRKLSFATFRRRPSIADITEPLPTPPHSATWTELAPPATLRGDTGRSLKHLPSLPTLGRSEVVTNTAAGPPAIPRRPSFSFTDQAPASQPVLKSFIPRRLDIADPPKSGILKSRTSPRASKQSPPDTGRSAEPTSIPRRQRSVTLSNSPGASSRSQVQRPGDAGVPPDTPGPEVKRIPSVPKLPRRLSIPMLRRKQSQPVIQDGENEGWLVG